MAFTSQIDPVRPASNDATPTPKNPLAEKFYFAAWRWHFYAALYDHAGHHRYDDDVPHPV
jgi:hypothetical protein